jgi:ABC-2 type transport system ATP-binding protein
MKVLQFNDVRRSYTRGKDVLNGVSFSVENGEVVGLLGRNGAGKTTLIRVAMGMLAAQHGSVQVLGMDPRRDAVQVKQRIGYVSEDQILPPFMTVEKIMALHRGLFPNWDDEIAAGLVERFHLPLQAKIRTLSKGQARQVALLCAVAHRPELLILDEPAGGLDPAARREFLETSIRLLNEAGSTILFSSHHMPDVERMAGRIVMLHQGRVLLDRDLDSLREEHCLAMVPRDAGADAELLAGLPGCIGTRERSGGVHALFRLTPSGCQQLLEERFGLVDANCTTIGLEDMFIELAGGNS